MKLGIISDLHLEFKVWNFHPEDYPEVDFWINAGDTHINRLSRDYFHKLFGDNYLYIEGNHDFYDGRAIEDPYSYCKTKDFDGIKFAGAPLWTDLSNPLDWLDYSNNLADKRFMNFKWNHESYMNHHVRHANFLLASGADVIVSHHLPSYESVHSKFRDKPLNACFATELSLDIISMTKVPKLWIHGHTHEKCDYMIGETRVICHPRGYPGEHTDYIQYKPLIMEI